MTPSIFDTGYDNAPLFRFEDNHHGHMAYALAGHFKGWLLVWDEAHGGWRTLREASPQDIAAVQKRIALGN